MSNSDNTLQRGRTRRLVEMAMLAAISIVLVMLIRIPLIPAAPFLEYDMADVPVLVFSRHRALLGIRKRAKTLYQQLFYKK